MRRLIVMMLFISTLTGCGQAELSTAAAINADLEAHMEELVQLEGTHVDRNDNAFFISTGRMNYLMLEDDSGRIRVWYDIAGRRCPPRLGARLSVEGKVVAAEQDQRHIFAAKSISIDDEPPLADREVRMCQLSLQEQQIHAEYGPEGLQDYWRDNGKPERVIVYE